MRVAQVAKQETPSVVRRARPVSVDAAGVLSLQRAAGNRITSALVSSRARRRRRAAQKLRFRVRLTGPLSPEQLKEEFIGQQYGRGTEAERASMRTRVTVPQRGPTPEEVARGFVDIELTVASATDLEALPEDIRRVLFAGGRDARALAPEDHARVMRIAGKLAQLTADERADYVARVNAATTSLDELEASIDSYIAFRAERGKQARAYTAAAERLAGAEDVYRAYRNLKDMRATLATRGQEEHYEVPEDRELARELYADLDQRVRKAESDLLAALKVKGFDSIAGFEAALEAYRVSFRTEAVNLALDVLARYEHMLFEARRKLEAGGAATIVQGIAATQAAALYKRHHEEQTIASTLIDPDARADARLLAMIATHKDAARAAKQQADAEVIRGSGGDPLIAGRDIDLETIAGLDAPGLHAYLLELTDERSKDVRTARRELEEDPDRVFWMPELIRDSMRLRGIVTDSVQARVIGDWITDEKAKHLFSQIALGILAFALAALVPAGGWIAAAAVVAGAGISGYEAYAAIAEYAEQERDWRLGFLAERPSLFWVGVAVAAAAADIGIATMILLKQSAAALKALEAPLIEFSNDSDLPKLLAKIDAAEDLGPELKTALTREARDSLADIPGRPAITPVTDELILGSGRGRDQLPIFHASREEARQKILDTLSRAVSERPPGWPRVREALELTPEPERGQILAQIENVMDALQEPRYYADVLADAWQLVRNGEAANINAALVKLARRNGVNVVEFDAILAGDVFFEHVASKRASFVDRFFDGGPHGAMTHLLQDLVVDAALGPGASGRFRELLGRAGGRVDRYLDPIAQTPSRFSTLPGSTEWLPNLLWQQHENTMRVGDYVWRFTYDYADGDFIRLPQPDPIKGALRSLLGFE